MIMSLASVRAFLAAHAPDIQILEMPDSTATVAQAAAAFGVEPGQIAKTLAFLVGGQTLILVARGDARLDNRKIRTRFGGKPRMLPLEDVEPVTGHPVGGVCPFGLSQPLPVYCDRSLLGFAEVLPAAGSPNSAVRITPERLAILTNAEWVDVCAETPNVD
ncbi:Hypothetical protein GbCGDNIH2_1717 [Granulibacter bethesdensis]|nr:Hypothetical protein GbCGDNIH2_1717 [Granulibacter bethesdensis]